MQEVNVILNHAGITPNQGFKFRLTQIALSLIRSCMASFVP